MAGVVVIVYFRGGGGDGSEGFLLLELALAVGPGALDGFLEVPRFQLSRLRDEAAHIHRVQSHACSLGFSEEGWGSQAN